MSQRYQRLCTSIDPCYTSFVEALRHLRASNTYHVTAGEFAYLDVKQLLQQPWACESPFAPVVNLTRDDTLKSHEWFITDEHGKSVGSEGGL